MVFSLKTSLSMYAVILILFIFVSPFLNGRFGILGLPLTHVLILLLPLMTAVVVYRYKFKTVFMLSAVHHPKYIGKGIALWILALIASSIYALFAVNLFDVSELTETFEYLFLNMNLSQQILIMAFIPAVIEELMFRGFLLSSFLGAMKPKYAIALSAFLFAVMHFSPAKLFTTFLLGIVFAYTAYKTKSVYSSMLLHFMNNMLAVAAQFMVSLM